VGRLGFETGFEIPGVLWRRDPETAELPLVLDSPHSGSVYPADFGFTCPLSNLRRAEDTYVDELYGAAPDFGATLIGALFPRSYLDPNRAADDLDPALIYGTLPRELTPRPSTRVGLIRRYARPGMPIYDRRLDAHEIVGRIERYHAPYHRALDETCDRLHAKYGSAWHINCHSMPSRPNRAGEHGDFVLGDRDRTSCDPEFTDFVAGVLRGMGYDVRINEGYKGVEIVRRQGRPAQNRHSLQIEVDRALYMDQRSLDRTPGFDRLQGDLTTLIEAVAEFVRAKVA